MARQSIRAHLFSAWPSMRARDPAKSQLIATGLALQRVRPQRTGGGAQPARRGAFRPAVVGRIRRVAASGISFAGTGPGVWLAAQESGSNKFAVDLESEIGAMAAVTDQSDGYAVLRLAGLKLRDA